jgi:hypothetical protein
MSGAEAEEEDINDGTHFWLCTVCTLRMLTCVRVERSVERDLLAQLQDLHRQLELVERIFCAFLAMQMHSLIHFHRAVTPRKRARLGGQAATRGKTQTHCMCSV